MLPSLFQEMPQSGAGLPAGERTATMPKAKIPLKTILQSFADFGTVKFPLRPSQLKKIANCNVAAIMEATGDILDEGGAGAQTGSVTHEAVAAFHKEQAKALKEHAGISALAASLPKFPLADRRSAEIYFEHYAKDPRNLNATMYSRVIMIDKQPHVVPAMEMPVSLTLPPHSIDTTGEPIYIEGTLDQIRLENGVPILMDYKTGETSGYAMQHDYAYQLAAYWVAAVRMGIPVQAAKIIRGYTYRERAKAAELPTPNGVFLTMPFTLKGAEILLDRLRREVALIRQGVIDFGPGPHCSYCKLKGLANCIPEAGSKFGFEWR